MSKKKRQGRGPAANSSNARPGASAAKCQSCDSAIQPEALYCHICGAPLRDGSARKQRDPVSIGLYSVIAISIVGIAVGVGFFASQNQVAPPSTKVNSSAANPQPLVDLSSISPREAADRLFNRVMVAHEQGNMQEVMQFAPKTLQAYDRVGNLDADAHFHIGLVHLATSEFDQVHKQVEILKQFSPNHLLGLFLEHKAAEETGDTSVAAKASAAFAAAYDSEIKTGRPEYEAHRSSIESFRAGIGDR